MSSFKTIIIIAILVALFLIFRPQIMNLVYNIKNDFSPVKKDADSIYQDFQRPDFYKREKKLEGMAQDQMSK